LSLQYDPRVNGRELGLGGLHEEAAFSCQLPAFGQNLTTRDVLATHPDSARMGPLERQVELKARS
jgi:hypothetical protein